MVKKFVDLNLPNQSDLEMIDKAAKQVMQSRNSFVSYAALQRARSILEEFEVEDEANT